MDLYVLECSLQLLLFQELYNHFIYEGVEVLNIGDSAQTRRIIEGVKEGRDILVALERQDFI